ncbi:MAG: hypothetical protein U1D30_16920 [Planctomycetota bacterium]
MFGLMSDYADALAEGELPFWNERWSFGFAGVAESQVGAFYPPHFVLYQLMPAKDAFRWNYLIHRLLIVLVAYASCRGLGLRTLGSWVATLVYAAGGFAIVHLDHLWSVESTVWFPLAVCLTHRWLLHGSQVALLALPWCLALQLAIGHFQLAFYTLVTMTLYAGMGFVWRRRLSGMDVEPRSWKRWPVWLIAVVMGYGLAGSQLLPTAYLAAYLRVMNPYNLSEDYLTLFALPPWMEVNLFLPYLYFREPLWRGVAWTTMRTSPEECLQFVGIVPMVLAMGAMLRWRRLPVVRIWTILLVLSVLLSFGSFLPGGKWLGYVPGFSFFRCAARWSMVTHWCFGFLAGFGADHLRTPRRLCRWWRNYTVAFVAVLLLAGSWWYLLDNAAQRGGSLPIWLVECADYCNPFVPGSATYAILGEMTSRRGADPYTWKLWERAGRADVESRLVDHWSDVILREILPTVVLVIVGLILLASIHKWTKRARIRWIVPTIIVGFCLMDFGMFRWFFPESSALPAQLESRGTVLARLRDLPEGSRVLGPGSNFLISQGVAQVRGFRTLDLPMPEAVGRTLAQLDIGFPRGDELLRAPPHSLLGIAGVLEHPLATRASTPALAPGPGLYVDADEALDWWLEGSTYTRRRLRDRGIRVQSALKLFEPSVPALVVPLTRFYDASDVGGLLGPKQRWQGLYTNPPALTSGTATMISRTRHSRSWKVQVNEPSLLVLGELYLPGWSATVRRQPVETSAEQVSASKSDMSPVDSTVGLVDDYWQGVSMATPGEYMVELSFHPPGFLLGLSVSIGSLVAWLALAAATWKGWMTSRSQT